MVFAAATRLGHCGLKAATSNTQATDRDPDPREPNLQTPAVGEVWPTDSGIVSDGQC